MKAVIFDLDGTLLNTLEDLADSVNQALQKHRFPVHPTKSYKLFVGKGMLKLVENALPKEKRTPENIQSVSLNFEQIYTQNWNKKTHLYAGISEMLSGLFALGIPVSILSNKPDEFVRLCVDFYLPKRHFRIIRGTLPNVPAKPHPKAALSVSQTLGIAPQDVFFIGDSSIDMKTAKAAKMTAIGVTWGFRSIKELLENGANYTVNQPSEILSIIQKNS